MLKGSVYPDEFADIGQHHFTYALYPHLGSWEEAGTIQAAMDLNHSQYVQINAAKKTNEKYSFLSCSAENIVLEAMKDAEDGKGVILRLVEQHNKGGSVKLHFDRPVRKAWTCDLMESDEAEIQADGCELELQISPCEIVTLRVCF
ncbi:MAG: hypothetical protein GY755_08815 [Chloroflexi bacterium]|nr:hypothetical protein [Chloroflexota bacterium]